MKYWPCSCAPWVEFMRVDERHLVHLPRHEREVGADADAIRIGLDDLGIALHFLVVRARVERVQVAHAAGHVEIDDIARGGHLLQRAGALAGNGKGLAALQLLQQADAEEGLGRAADELAAGGGVVGIDEGVHGWKWSE